MENVCQERKVVPVELCGRHHDRVGRSVIDQQRSVPVIDIPADWFLDDGTEAVFRGLLSQLHVVEQLQLVETEEQNSHNGHNDNAEDLLPRQGSDFLMMMGDRAHRAIFRENANMGRALRTVV